MKDRPEQGGGESSLKRPAPDTDEEELPRGECISTVRVRCRAEEANVLVLFAISRINNKSGGAVLLSGPPGTGKTHLANEFVSQVKQVKPPVFQKISYINCLSEECESAMLEAMSTRTLLRGKDVNLDVTAPTEDAFKTAGCTNNRFSLVVLDELDSVMLRSTAPGAQQKRHMVFQLLREAVAKKSTTLLIGISRSAQLYEKLDEKLGASNQAFLHIPFDPYTGEELLELLTSSGSDLHRLRVPLDRDALEHCANKIGSSTGDFREALQICSLASYAAETSGSKSVHRQHVADIISNATTASALQFRLLSLPVEQILFVMCVGFLQERKDEVRLAEVCDLCRKAQARMKMPETPNDDYWRWLHDLTDQERDRRFLVVRGKPTYKAKVALNFSATDLKVKRRSCPLLRYLHSVLGEVTK